MIIAIDFDGTVVTHEFPNVGHPVGAEKVLKRLVKNGHKLILNTMRSHKESNGKDTLADAEQWFKDRGIELYGVNKNPEQSEWTDSPKVYANLYIDDSALGCPKKQTLDGKITVDWDVIEKLFENSDLI